MGRRRTGVNKVRDIIRYDQTTDLSERQIARALGVSRTVVAWTLQTFRARGLEYPAVEQLPDAVLVDWARDKLDVINGVTGQSWALDQFVAILGASELTYVEARESQEEQQWIRANEGAFQYFGGVTSALMPDNLKTAVIRADAYEPGLNPVFEDFARHYGVVITPTRVRRPRDKALVEGAVRLVYQRISARLRGKMFFSLTQVNAAIRELLEEHNCRPFSRLAYSRRQLFERVEMHALPRCLRSPSY